MWRTILFLFFILAPLGWANCEKQYASNAELSGALRCFDEQGRLQSLGFYKQGLLNGESKVWDPGSGGLMASAVYVDGNLEGIRRTFFKEGVVQTETPFHVNRREGVEREWAVDGRLRMATEWQGDSWTTRAFFDEVGRLIRREIAKEGVVDYEKWYSNGVLSESGSYLLEHADLLEGTVRQFRKDKSLSRENRYADGSMDGLQKTWDEAGGLRTREWYQMGRLVGLTVYDPQGRVESSEEFFGEFKPVPKAKFANGRVDESSEIALGRRQGIHREYDEVGRLRLESNYEKGVLEGTLRAFFSDGKRSQLAEFHQGEKFGLEETFYQNGKPRSRGFYKFGLKEGKWQQFDPHGHVEFDGEYLQGRPNGWANVNLEMLQYDRGVLIARKSQTVNETYYPDGSVR
jgi:antitoxin component YwqK of YwqJK toxin-antitoxin module